MIDILPPIRAKAGISSGFSGAPTKTNFPCVLTSDSRGRRGWVAETVSMIPSKVPLAAWVNKYQYRIIILVLSYIKTQQNQYQIQITIIHKSHLHLLLITADQEWISPKTFSSLLLLVRRGTNHSNLSAEGLSKFDGDMAEPTKTNHTNFHSRLIKSKISQRAVNCDTSTKQGSPGLQRDAVGNANNEMLIGNHTVGVASVGYGAVRVLAGVGEDHFGAIVLKVVGTVITGAAGSNHTSYANFISDLEILYFASNLGYLTHDFMTTNSNNNNKNHTWTKNMIMKIHECRELIQKWREEEKIERTHPGTMG